MPCEIVRGTVGELTLNVPWMNITRENISLNAKNCFALFRIDLSRVHEYCREREKVRGDSMIKEMEQKVVETFKKFQNKKSNYFSHLIQGLLKNMQVNIENVRIRIEFIDLAEPLVGGYELIFNQFNYDNLVANIAETRFEGELVTNGLSILDLRLKGISKERIITLNNTTEAVRKQSLEDFKLYFKNEANPSYIVCPFVVQANFTWRYTNSQKDTYKGVRSIEFSPFQVNISNQDIQVACGFKSLLSTVQEYGFSRRVVVPYPIRNSDLTERLTCLNLHSLLLRVWRMKNDRFRRASIETARKLKHEYMYCYETKIFHLMESEFENTSERLFDLQLKIPTYDLTEEKTIEEIINRCFEIEKLLHASIILNFRDQTMKKCRTGSYFKTRLVEQKKRINQQKEKNAGISGILRKGINRIWGSSVKDTESDIDNLMHLESVSKVDKDIKEKLIKTGTKIEAVFEFKCPVVKLCLTRNKKCLLEVNTNNTKYTDSKDLEALKGSQILKIQKMMVSDGEGKVFLEIIKDESEPEMNDTHSNFPRDGSGGQILPFTRSNYCLDLNLQYSLYKDVETEELKRTSISADLRVDHFYVEFSRDLLSKLIYFSIDFSDRFSPSNPGFSSGSPQASQKSSSSQSSLGQFLNSVMRLDESLVSCSISIRSITLVLKHSMLPMFVGSRLVPALKLQKNELEIKTSEVEVFYDDSFFALKTSLTNKTLLTKLRKIFRPIDFHFTLLRRTENRLSLDVKAGVFEIFVSDTCLEICSQIAVDFLSTKLLHTDSFLEGLKKDSKATSKAQKKKPMLVPRLAQTLNNRKSSRQSYNRKASGNTFFTGNSDMQEDEFFDAFEDETELFAHNELKTRLDLIENVGMMLPGQLAIIEENHKAHPGRNNDTKPLGKRLPIELSITLVLEELVSVLYSKNDPENYIQINLTQLRLFCDFKEISIKTQGITAILKQNLLTLIMKDFAAPLAPLNAALNKNENKSQTPEKPRRQATMEESSPDNYGSPANVRDKALQKGLPSPLDHLKAWIQASSNDIHFEFDIQGGVHVYLTEQISHAVSPGIYLTMKPCLTFSNKTFRFNSNMKIDIFNEEIGIYEPFVEEFLMDLSVGTEYNSLKIENLVNSLLVNLKPSILKNMFDYLSVYSSQKIKLSAERNSVITIRNESGVAISYQVNMSGMTKTLKPYEICDVNLVVMPRETETGSRALDRACDHSVSSLSFVANKAVILKSVGRFGDDKSNISYERNRHTLGTSFFSKKKIVLQIPSFGCDCQIDLSNMTDAHIRLTKHIFLVAKLEIDNYHTVLTLRSNYRIVNKLDFDVECAVFLHRPHAYAKDEVAISNGFAGRRRKKSDAYSEGECLSVADSDFSVNDVLQGDNHFKETQSEIHEVRGFHQTAASSAQEERKILQFKFVIPSRGKKFLPLLKNFPNNYFIMVKPAHVDFYKELSDHPGLEMSQVKGQSQFKNWVFFDDIFSKLCRTSKIDLKHSVNLASSEIGGTNNSFQT